MSDEMKTQFTRIMQELYGFSVLWTKDGTPHHPFEYDPDREAPSLDCPWAVFSAAWNRRTPAPTTGQRKEDDAD